MFGSKWPRNDELHIRLGKRSGKCMAHDLYRWILGSKLDRKNGILRNRPSPISKAILQICMSNKIDITNPFPSREGG